METKHRFSNSTRVRQQVLELARKPEPVQHQDFVAADWAFGIPQRSSAIHYAKVVLAQQDVIVRRLFWTVIIGSFLAGVVGGAVGAAAVLVK